MAGRRKLGTDCEVFNPDRRTNKRYPLRLTVLYSTVDALTASAGAGRTVDISSSAVCFTTESRLPVESVSGAGHQRGACLTLRVAHRSPQILRFLRCFSAAPAVSPPKTPSSSQTTAYVVTRALRQARTPSRLAAINDQVPGSGVAVAWLLLIRTSSTPTMSPETLS